LHQSTLRLEIGIHVHACDHSSVVNNNWDSKLLDIFIDEILMVSYCTTYVLFVFNEKVLFKLTMLFFHYQKTDDLYIWL